MDISISTAIISGLCVAIPTIISVIVTSNTRDAVHEERLKYLSEKIDTLTAKVQLHNGFGQRLAIAEHDIEELKRGGGAHE